MRILLLSISVFLYSFTVPNKVTFNRGYNWSESSQTEFTKQTTFSIDLSKMELYDTLYIGGSKFQYYRLGKWEVVVCDYIIFSLTISEGDSGVTYLK